MKQFLYTLLAILLMATITLEKTSAKEVMVPKMYIFGFAASFNDTIVHFTNVMDADSVWVQSKNKFLIGRDAYSRQFKQYLADKLQMPQRTCVVIYGKNKKKVEKKYLKMKRLYTHSKDGKPHFDVRYLNDGEFRFSNIDIESYIVSEQERINQAKEQERLAKEQKEMAKQQKKEARKARKEVKQQAKALKK